LSGDIQDRMINFAKVFCGQQRFNKNVMNPVHAHCCFSKTNVCLTTKRKAMRKFKLLAAAA